MPSCHPVQHFPRVLQPVPALVAGVLVHLTLGTMYSIGNMTPYIISYLRVIEGSNVTDSQAGWVAAFGTIGTGSMIAFGGMLERAVGPRFAALTGSLLVSLGALLSFVTIKHSFWAVAGTFGLLYGFGVGIAYAPPIVCATRWLPKYKGLVIGIIVAGFGCGALIFNQVQTHFINPDNIAPDKNGYFQDKDVLHRVPHCFLLLGGIYLAMQFVGFCLMVDAPAERVEELRQLTIAGSNEYYAVRPLQFMKSPTFYILWLTFLFNGLAISFIGSYYKLFGQTFIDDDVFLATTGSVASVLNAVGRIFWGTLVDFSSYQVAMAAMTISLSFLFLTLQYAVYGGKSLYMIWVVLIFFVFSGSFCLLPFATAKSAGQNHFGVNYGLVFTSQVVAAIMSAFLTQNLLGVINYNGIFFMVAAFTFVSFLLTTLIGITRHGHPDLSKRISFTKSTGSSDHDSEKHEEDPKFKE